AVTNHADHAWLDGKDSSTAEIAGTIAGGCTANPTTAIAKAENVSRGETFEGLWAIAFSSHLIQLGNQHNAVPNVFVVVDWFDLLGFSLMLFDKIVGAHW